MAYSFRLKGATLEDATDNYYALVKALVDSLRDFGVAELPDLGKFYIKVRKEKRYVNKDKKEFSLPRKKRLFFKPCKKIDQYFELAEIKNIK